LAQFNSRSSVFQITDSGGTLRNISQFITALSGLPGQREMNEVTALGDTGRRHLAGLDDVTVRLEGIWDDTASTGPDAVLGPLRSDDTARAWDYGPKGTSTGSPKYSGTMKLRSYDIVSRVGDIVVWRAELAVQGAVARGVY
jgi:hypothetical protein